jgi:hypothetical protein
MKLSVKQLQAFFKLASSINSNGIVPVYEYLLIEKNRITKTNGRTFIAHTIDADVDESILLKESMVQTAIRFTNSDVFEITVKGNKGLLSDGTTKENFQIVPAKDFPKFPEYSREEVFEFDYDILEAIGIASKCVSVAGLNSNFEFVHLHNNMIYASDISKMFIKKFNKLPNAYLDAESASVISQFNSVNFFQKGTYNFFEAGNTIYGFQQFGDVKPFDISKFLDNDFKGDFFEFEVKDFTGFCDWVQMASPVKGQEVLICYFKGGNLSFNKPEIDKTIDRDIAFSGSFMPDMHFTPKYVSPYLKSLGKSIVRLYPFTAGVYVRDPDDKDFIGMFARIAPQP